MPAIPASLRRRLIAPALIALAALAATTPSAVAAGSWSSPVTLAAAGSEATGASAFVAPDGRTLVVYASGGAVHLAAGDVAGRFSAPTTLATADAVPTAALGPDGTLAAAWSAGGEAHVVVQRPGAAPVESTLPGPGAADVDVAVGADGAVTVAYRTKASPSSYALVSSTAPAGGAFPAPATLASGSAPIQCVDTAVAPSGATAVAFCRQTPKYRAHVTVRPAGAGAYETPQKLSESAAPDITVHVAAEADGTFVVAWSNPEGAGYAVRPAGAGAFGAAGRLSAAGEAGYAVDVASAPAGGAAATWTNGKRIQAAALAAGAGAFGAIQPVTDVDHMIVPDPRIAVAPDGSTTVLVIDPGSGEVRAGAPGAAAQLIGYSVRDQATPRPALAASADRTVAVWRDATGALVAATRSAQAPPATGVGSKPPAIDRTKPKVTVKDKSRAIRVTSKTKSISFKVSCNEACAISAGASLRTQLKGQKRKIAPLVSVRAGKPRKGTQKVTFKLGTLARKDLQAALRQGRGGQVYVDLTAADAANNTTRTTWRTSVRGR